ncbi:hypothetical protein INT47_004269 [Mucor saturninus]|uniref:50S ribosomal protein L9, chloroplastic n=1 Tax=Mucor saturninus TaxID=64648 RepID=A0A8H7VAR3_9FUNG|nr:hypothetical protein INT47_004269 [Mucor saturninus]
MSFILRPFGKNLLSCSSQVLKRHAHKKANIQVKLNQFVEGVGLENEVVAVRPGLMRNILYPAGKATYIDKKAVIEGDEEDKSMEEASSAAQLLKEAVDMEKKKVLMGHLEGVRELLFNRAVVPNSDHTFGSVTAEDLISKLKEEFGLDVDKSTIEFKSEGGRIKSLGQHKVSVQIGQETAEINVVVNPV